MWQISTSLLRNGSKDILQELMEAEPDATLGYEKNREGNMNTENKCNGYFPKEFKSQYGEFQIDVPRYRNGEFEPKIIPKYREMFPGSKKRSSHYTAEG